MHRRSESRRIALGGVFGALALALMLAGGLLPLATFAAPAFAGLLLVPVAIECGVKAGLLAYAAIGLLALFLVADKEMALIFLFFLGFYPLAKIGLEKLRRPAVRWASKFALFNACVLSMYAIILFVFPLPAVVLEFEGMGQVFIFFLLALANLTFLLYDKAIERLTALYCCKIRNKLLR